MRFVTSNDLPERRLGNALDDVKAARLAGAFPNVAVAGGLIGKGLTADRAVEGIGVVLYKMLDDIRDGAKMVL